MDSEGGSYLSDKHFVGTEAVEADDAPFLIHHQKPCMYFQGEVGDEARQACNHLLIELCIQACVVVSGPAVGLAWQEEHRTHKVIHQNLPNQVGMLLQMIPACACFQEPFQKEIDLADPKDRESKPLERRL